MNAFVQSLAMGEQERPSALQRRLSAKGLLARVRQAFTPNAAAQAGSRPRPRSSPAAAAVMPSGAMPAALAGIAAQAPKPAVPRVRAGTLRRAVAPQPAWSTAQIGLRDANDVFRRHQRALGKLHGHEVAVGIARGRELALAGAAVASRPRLAFLDDALTAEVRGIAVADDVPGGEALLLAAISRAALESGFRRLVWRKKAGVVPFELVRAGWDRMPGGCLPAAPGDGFTWWFKVLRGQEWLR